MRLAFSFWASTCSLFRCKRGGEIPRVKIKIEIADHEAGLDCFYWYGIIPLVVRLSQVNIGGIVVRQFVVPDMKRISFCLEQALRFGIAG